MNRIDLNEHAPSPANSGLNTSQDRETRAATCLQSELSIYCPPPRPGALLSRPSMVSAADIQVITMTKKRKIVRFNAVPYDLNTAEQNKVITLALNILTESHLPGQVLSSPKETIEYQRLRFSEYKNEVFFALFIDNRHLVLGFEELFFGAINGASVYSSVVVQRSMEVNTAAVIFAHNHPSGVSEPSPADKVITNGLKDALEILDVRVLDHIVVGAVGNTSFAETWLW